MEINVACASSLFKENGHDLKGLFNLLYNAVYAYVGRTVINMQNTPDADYCLMPIPDNRELVANYISSALENFQPDIEKAVSRIAQFNQEYKELKEASEKIREVSLWTIFTRSNKQINAYIKRKREIENETITIAELLNVTFCKFSQVNGTLKQFREGLVRFLDTK